MTRDKPQHIPDNVNVEVGECPHYFEHAHVPASQYANSKQLLADKRAKQGTRGDIGSVEGVDIMNRIGS